ncbi:MAG: hypothetical protein HY657_10145 [Acidobacteria bacterium]|nr:hypothetical protein [Acidobacteriota bacterium]
MRRAPYALAAYLVITLAATWPLAAGLGRDVAWDLGDPVLNMWILAWDCEQIRAILGGDVSRVLTFFDANIFHPAPLSLAYSEHLIAQAIQILPVYLVTGNPILCYNLLFLSTFVLSGLGMYLLVRELTGNAAAAFIAGLVFAFAPYRVPQSSHLQVLSSQWMPFALYLLRRYFDTGRVALLGGAALAVVAQNLSCGYYLLYFTPFVAAYALWEIGQRRRWSHARTWMQLGAAAAIAVALTALFVLPYATLRARMTTARLPAEVSRFSADVHSYVTPFGEQRVWGRLLRGLPKPEGELFPGVVPILLALVGVATGFRGRGRAPRQAAGPKRRGANGPPYVPAWVAIILGVTAAAHGAAAAITIVMRRITVDAGLFVLRIGNVNQLLLRAATAFGLLLVVSPTARARIGGLMGRRGYFLLGLLAALWLSLGPAPQSLGRPLEIVAPYRLLFEHVPGFDGLRVPARFSMIALLMLAALAGYGAAALGTGIRARWALAVGGVLFLLEATHVPFQVNVTSPIDGFATPEARLYRPERAPAVYGDVARLAPDAVLVELPLGQPDYDLRAMYYSTVHWRPLLNGYSGFFPPHYGQLWFAVNELPRHPETSMQALRAGGATHAIVHEAAFLGGEGPATSGALRALGAVELFRDGADVLFALPP